MEQAAELSTWLVLRAGMEHQLLPSGAADVPCISLLAVVVDIAGTAAALVGPWLLQQLAVKCKAYTNLAALKKAAFWCHPVIYSFSGR